MFNAQQLVEAAAFFIFFIHSLLMQRVLNEDQVSRDACFNGAACEISQHLVVRKGTANKKPPVSLFIVFSFMSLKSNSG